MAGVVGAALPGSSWPSWRGSRAHDANVANDIATIQLYMLYRRTKRFIGLLDIASQIEIGDLQGNFLGAKHVLRKFFIGSRSPMSLPFNQTRRQ